MIEETITMLETAGYVFDGKTRKGDRQRFILPDTDRRATVGHDVVNFYRVINGNENDGHDWTNINVRDRLAIEEHLKHPPGAFRITQSDAIQLIDAVVNGRVSILALGIAQRMKDHFMLQEILHDTEKAPC